MAQRTEKEETEFKVPETLTLCVNNCGVTGNPATNNMCQNCFNSTTATSSSSSSSSSATTTAIVISSTGDVAGGLIRKKTSRSSPFRSPNGLGTSPATPISRNRQSPDAAEGNKIVNRCSGCRRRVGLTGFRCRCGELFCAEHRYSDRHDCSYDYKAAGREAIARENPVVRPAKILKV